MRPFKASLFERLFKGLFTLLAWAVSLSLAIALCLFDGFFPEEVWLISSMAVFAFAVIVLSKLNIPLLSKFQRGNTGQQ